jgi:glyoxylase-like metal-dependent hydrolase (beta-lactamase superfamily II)
MTPYWSMCPSPVTRCNGVGDWVEASGKRLTVIYATHGHGDHWFGTNDVLQRFPGAVAYATTGAIEFMHTQATVGRQGWDDDFPGLIPDAPVVYEAAPGAGFFLEGHRMVALEMGHTDTDATSVLHVPSIGLVVAGDVVYNGVHQYLLEGAGNGLQEWLRALDAVETLDPRAVVAGHKNRALPDDPVIVSQTRAYLLDAQRLLGQKPSPQAFFQEMIDLYPSWLNPSPLWYSAVGLLP